MFNCCGLLLEIVRRVSSANMVVLNLETLRIIEVQVLNLEALRSLYFEHLIYILQPQYTADNLVSN